MRDWWCSRRGLAGEGLPSCGQFRFGVPIWEELGYTPMFCEEWASRVDSAGYGWHVFESVQGIEIIGFAGVRKCNSERRCVDA
jgi:hypothetical protein